MGHSIQIVGSRRECFSDLDLLLTIQILVEVFEARGATCDGLAETVGRWKEIPDSCGPGTIDLYLSDLNSDPGAAAEFITLSHNADRLIEEFGGTIRAEVANGRRRVPGVIFSDYGTSRLLSTTDRLRSLLGG